MEVFIASSGGEQVIEIEKNENVKHYKIPLTRTLSPLKDLIALIYLIKLIRRIKPDIVHTHSPKAGIVGMLASWLCRVPLKIHTVAGLPLMNETGIKKKILMIVERLTYYFSDWVLSNSIQQIKYIESFILKRKILKLTIIGKGSSNGINLKHFGIDQKLNEDAIRIREINEISDSAVVLSFVGRLANYKGISELVEAFDVLCRQNKNIKLFLIGPIEELNPLSFTTSNLISNNSDIICTGHINDIRPYLFASDIFIFPSYREGFPQSLMQASAMNKPCIATDIHGCNEIIFDNFNGFLIPPRDSHAIIEKCQILIDNPLLRMELGGRGRKYLQSNFEQTQFWYKVLDFYKEKLKY